MGSNVATNNLLQDRRTHHGRSPSVLIIGGGLAGLAAASILGPRGFRVTLIESRLRLGGRASSFADPASGETIDNCQHVGLGCCTNWRDFCRRVGVEPLIERDATTAFLDERGRLSLLQPARLPAPLHLAPGFAKLGFLSWIEKLRIANAMFHLVRPVKRPIRRSFLDWLIAHGQTVRTCERYWAVILNSALNESLERIDFLYARQVFVEGFLRHPDACTLEIPRVPLSELYGAAMESWLAANGVTIHTNMAATRLEASEDRRAVALCRTRHQEFTADYYVLAVPFQRLSALLSPAMDQLGPMLAALRGLESSPITSIHLWYDRRVLNRPHLVPIGKTVHWLFRREEGMPDGETQYIQAVVSASRALEPLGKDRIQEIVVAEIADVLPAARSARVLRAKVVTERAATFSVVPGVDAVRPGQETPICNLWLAGDYTRTGWPATMEGAVRSGYLAAEGVLAASGRAETVLQPPLAAGRLVRWLLREGGGSSMVKAGGEIL